jgi:O-antigen/teichoic acid export membrane protein
MEEVGLYTATYKLMWMVMSFLSILSTVFFPLIARASAKDSNTDSPESELYLKFLFMAALPLIAGGILLAEPLTTFIIGKEYVGSGVLFSLLLPNVLFGGLAIYYAGMRLIALNRNREYVVAVTIGALVNVGANLIAIPLWGSVGAAITTCLSQAAVAGVAAWYGRQHRGPRLVTSAKVPVVASVCMTIVLAMVIRFPGLHVLMLVMIGAGAYAVVSMAVRNRWT